jgi:hypothetical protein
MRPQAVASSSVSQAEMPDAARVGARDERVALTKVSILEAIVSSRYALRSTC